MTMQSTTDDVPLLEDAVDKFSIETLRAGLAGDLDRAVNACVECCDRHVQDGRIALQWVSSAGTRQTFTFAQLMEASARVANMLVTNGIKPGDTVAGMMPRTPELVATILGTWRAGAIYQPLFTAFGTKAVEHRLAISGASFIVTDSANRHKLDGIVDCPRIATVAGPAQLVAPGDIDFAKSVEAQSSVFEPIMRTGEDVFLMMATSGTTGLAKGVAVPLKALLAIGAYMRFAIDLREDDVFWNLADPGWAYGLYYAIVGPLLLGRATTLFEGSFTAQAALKLIEQCGITNLAGAPTAYRLIAAAGEAAVSHLKGQLRVASSAGEPLNPYLVRWYAENLDVALHDHYGQTEIGMVVANHHGLRHPLRVGSAGLPMPGYRVVVLDEQSNELGPKQPGLLAIDIARSPLLWFGGYWQQDTPAISDGYYRTGDTVELERDGSVSFIGRADDVITSSGYRIGPFDVESTLAEHPAVMESAVVGVPDPERTELVKAFVVLAPGHEPSPELAEALSQHVKTRLAAHAYPRLVEFVQELPKTPSGKIQRFLLRA